MNKKIILSLATSFFLFPVTILAVTLVAQPGMLTDINIAITALFNLLWPIFGAYAIIMFIVAGIQFLSARGESSEVAKARQSVIWGTAGVAVALLAFSIPLIVKTLLGV